MLNAVTSRYRFRTLGPLFLALPWLLSCSASKPPAKAPVAKTTPAATAHEPPLTSAPPLASAKFVVSLKLGSLLGTLERNFGSSGFAANDLRALLPASCAVTSQANEAIAVCAAPHSALEGANAQQAADTTSDLAAQFTIKSEALSAAVFGLRSSVPYRVDSLLAPVAKLKENLLAVSALSELGYDQAFTIAEAYDKIGALRGAMTFGEDASASYEVSAQLASNSRLYSALGAGQPLAAPNVFWDLPSDVESAMFTKMGTLRPLFEPSKRALSLLDAISKLPGEGELAKLLLQVFSSCSQADSALVFAETRAYRLFGVEDAGGTCGKSVAALLRSYASHAKGGAQILPTKALARAELVLEVSNVEGQRSSVALLLAKGTSWLAMSEDVKSLQAPFEALLDSKNQKLKRLRDRAELRSLVEEPVLAGGFVVDLPQGISAKATNANGNVPRMTLKLRAENSNLVLSGTVPARTTARALATLIDDLSAHEFAKHSEADQSALLRALGAACRLGSDSACNRLGVMYMEGSGVAKNERKAQELFNEACVRSEPTACVYLGFVSKHDPDRALRSFARACDLDEPFGCAWYGDRLYASDKLEDQKLAVSKLSYACERKVAFACLGLGASYREGKGVSVDPEKSAEYYERACRLGHGIGCVGLGTAYCEGTGREKDPERCFKLFERACDLNKAFGCYALGAAYVNATGTPKNIEAARKLFKISCQAGHDEACRVLTRFGGGEDK